MIPLSRRADIFRVQYALLASDPALHSCEVVYVPDSPEHSFDMEPLARQLHGLYRLPFRFAALPQTRGRDLLFLASDVYPASPGWLPKLSAFYRSGDNIGILGAKLLQHDDSTGGMPRSYPLACVTSEVSAISEALLYIERDFFDSLGGWPTQYPLGDCAGEHLSRASRAAGRQCWRLAEVELYHLEGQAHPSEPWRQNAAHYSNWLLNA